MNDIQRINKEAFNNLTIKKSKNSNASLPFYGKYTATENELQYFKDVRDKKVLELGCGKGESLRYLKDKGASEIWGLDISDELIKEAKTYFKDATDTYFFVSPMEENPGIPENYFDYVISIFSMGYSTDLDKTFDLINSYLKPNGMFVMSWTHPFFQCLDVKVDNSIIDRNYLDEEFYEVLKGESKEKTIIKNYKISSYINGMIKAGLVIDDVVEEKTNMDISNSWNSGYWNNKRFELCPTTIIIKAHKEGGDRNEWL